MLYASFPQGNSKETQQPTEIHLCGTYERSNVLIVLKFLCS